MRLKEKIIIKWINKETNKRAKHILMSEILEIKIKIERYEW